MEQCKLYRDILLNNYLNIIIINVKVKAGDVLKVNNNSFFPADMILLKSRCLDYLLSSDFFL